MGQESTPRRRFLWTAWLGLLGIMVAEGVWVLVDFLRPRRARARTDDAGVVVAGPVDQFEPGSVTAFPQGRFYLVRLEDGGFLAVSRECTHLGCTVPRRSTSVVTW
jgi:cytochrome b6-f complex iron-sulfur subunit